MKSTARRKTSATLTADDRAQGEAIVAEVRRRDAYHLARAWLDRFVLSNARPRTKGVLVGVGSVALLLRASLQGREKGRPMIASAMADRDLGETLIVALIDSGFRVEDRPQRWLPGRYVACNVSEAALWAAARSNTAGASL